jgi:hypothetical protein
MLTSNSLIFNITSNINTVVYISRKLGTAGARMSDGSAGNRFEVFRARGGAAGSELWSALLMCSTELSSSLERLEPQSDVVMTCPAVTMCFILRGRARFHDVMRSVVAELSPREGALIPAGTTLNLSSIGDETLEMVSVHAGVAQQVARQDPAAKAYLKLSGYTC